MAEKDEIRGHSFDGIEEYDNDLPRWWLAIFFVTAVYSVFYIVWMHMGFRDSDSVLLARELEALESLRPKAVATGDDSSLIALASQSAVLKSGEKIFVTNCAACHRPDGGGMIGPNLTDNHTIHGGKITDIRKVVVEGVPSKGMIPWGSQLKSGDIDAVVAFIWSLKGSSPPNPKAPEGTEEGASANETGEAPLETEDTPEESTKDSLSEKH